MQNQQETTCVADNPGRQLPTLILSLICSLCLTTPLRAQESASPWWNPFANQKSSNSNTRASSFFDGGGAKEKSVFQLPAWMVPSFGSKKSAKALSQTSAKSGATSMSSAGTTSGSAKKPSTLDKLSTSTKKWTASTKRMWDDTVDWVNPFDNPQSQPSKSRGYQPQIQQQISNSGGVFSWFSSPKPEKEIQDVNGFLRQPRPKF